MLIENQVEEFLSQDYKKVIMSQIPCSYSAESAVLNILLRLDLSKILRANRPIATTIISQFPAFEAAALKAISTFLRSASVAEPEHGIHLVVKITNCPLPVQNIKGA